MVLEVVLLDLRAFRCRQGHIMRSSKCWHCSVVARWWWDVNRRKLAHGPFRHQLHHERPLMDDSGMSTDGLGDIWHL